MKKNKQSRKGFTLIELLVVIAILAVLAVVVVLTLNPAGLLQEARDSNRVSDMASLKSALALYLADVSSPALAPSATGTNECYVSIPMNSFSVPTSSFNSLQATTTCGSWFATLATTTVVTSSPNRTITGTAGWIPVNLSLITSGAPFSVWPIDPLNNNSYFYSYEASTTGNVYKVNMFMESTKYQTNGTVTGDGGIDNFSFEGGSNLTM